MNRIHTRIGSAIVASILAATPIIASADSFHASSSTGVLITPNGIVRVIGANVTSVGTNIVNAVTTFGNVVLNWTLNLSNTTKVAANGSKNATTTDIKVGDKVSFLGALSGSVGNNLTVAASKVRDITSFPLRHIGAGKITSINTANNSFVITQGERTVTVQANASTTFSLNGATTTFASLQTGQKVGVAGVFSADGSVITASKVVVKHHDEDKDKQKEDRKENKNNNDDDNKDNDDKNKSGKDAHLRAHLNLFGALHVGGSGH